MDKAAIFGTGAWATALALVLCRRGLRVVLRAHEPGIAEELERAGENSIFLPGFQFPSNLHVVYDMGEALEGSGLAVMAVPSIHLRSVARLIPDRFREGSVWAIATKGLEEGTGMRMSEVLRDLWPEVQPVTLAGPSLAREVAAGKPTTVLSASSDATLAEKVRAAFHGPDFRVYTSGDPIGVELGTSLKNVIALAAGIADGMELGANAKGALVTRGLAEITRLGVAMNARRETFLGLAGVGDLVTTCSSPLSRNRTLGEQIGRGVPVAEAMAGMTQVAEGVPTTRSAVRLARERGVEMPISEQVHRVLFESLDPRDALRGLMERPPRMEEE